MNINITIYEGNNTLNVSDYTPTVTLTVVENLYQSGGGGGAVDSVNGKTGVVVLGANDIAESATLFWLTDALKSAYNQAVTTANSCASWISSNGTNLLNHLSNTSNPHSVTASQVGLGNVNNTSDANKPISTATQTALDLKANKATQRSGSVIAFDTDANYGTIASPLTGNITGDYTDAIIGVVQMLIHNDSVAPTIPATWIKANTSASYTTGVVNYIAVTWLSSNIATYTIWKSV